MQVTQSFKEHSVMGAEGTHIVGNNAVNSRPEIKLRHFEGIRRHSAFCLLGSEGEMNRLITQRRVRRVEEQLAQMRPLKVGPERDF